MYIKDNSKEKVDLNFYEIIKILNKFKIKYWICQGTLLGIIRDNQLIPWDHDIDIAIWSGSVSKERIKEIMLSHNFNLKKKYLLEDDLLTFTKQGGREVDFNFYQITIEKKIKQVHLVIVFVLVLVLVPPPPRPPPPAEK